MINVLIHAVPKRMAYVEKYLIPSLQAQGIEPKVYCDTQKLGNLQACLRSFSQLPYDGSTWHLQDDVLIARDFAEKVKYIKCIANAFCFAPFGDNPLSIGTVYAPDLWSGFPCVHIPNAIAHEFVYWIYNCKHSEEADIRIRLNRGDDYLFHEFIEEMHDEEPVCNVPDLVEHVDWLIGGSIVNEWRGYMCRNDTWTDKALVEELKTKLIQAP